MTTILTPTAEYSVAARDGLWMSASDAAKVTGWILKPEGMCRDDLCVPLPAAAVKGKDVDVAAFWTKLGGPVVAAEDGEVWALGAPADETVSQRGVRHGQLHLVPADRARGRHSHGGGSHEHEHIHA